MTYDAFLIFLEEFEKLPSFAQKIEYTNNNLSRIGSGSGRIVYDIDGTKVFKIAKNSKGVAQNEEEINVASYYDTKDIVTEIFESANNGTWIVAEMGKKVNEKRIIQLTGIPNLQYLHLYLLNAKERYSGRREMYHLNDEVKEQLQENEWVMSLSDFLLGYNQSVGDTNRASTYGEVMRDGEPTIVLNDYGLSDEVYTTHYDPQRKKHRVGVYELYNNADGNDDMLSDIGNVGNEIRHGMWAIQPYSVSDGDGVINEDIISFIENRETYPNKPMKYMGDLADSFHECVNNLNYGLKNAKNKHRFYKNLINLQEYLIKNNQYDRDPLPKELNEGIEENNAVLIANAVAQKYGYEQPKHIGGGTFGHAYDVGNDIILKVTTDRSEAVENLELLDKQPEHIAKPYAVYEITSKTEPDRAKTWAILLEKLRTDNEYFERMFKRMNFVIKTLFNLRFGNFAYFLIGMYHRDVDEDQYRKLNKYLSSNPEDFKFFEGLSNIVNEAVKYGIESTDFVNPSNLGFKKDGSIGFFDVGFGNYFTTSQVQPQTMEVNEGETSLYTTDGDAAGDGFPPYAEGYYGSETVPDAETDVKTVNEDLIGKVPYDRENPPAEIYINPKSITRFEPNIRAIADGNSGDLFVLNHSELLHATLASYLNTHGYGVPIDYGRLYGSEYNYIPLKRNGKTNDFYLGELYDLEDISNDENSISEKLQRVKAKNPTINFIPKSIMEIEEGSAIDERIVSAMKGSSSVEVKKKCRLAGNGNTSTACNQGDVNNLKIKSIDEEIDASEAYTDAGAVNTVLSGKRDVAFVHIYDDTLNEILDKGFMAMLVKQSNHKFTDGMKAYVIYSKNGTENAKKLYDYLMSRGGYAQDKTAAEARYIGKLLGYSDKSIENFIIRHYSDTLTLESLNEGLVNVPFHDHRGWISPDNKYIDSPSHISYLYRLYGIDYNQERSMGSDDNDKLYNRAFDEGYTRVDFDYVKEGVGILAIHAPDIERLREILKNVYYKALVNGGHLYVDTGKYYGNDPDKYHGSFEFPKDKMKFNVFLEGNAGKLDEKIEYGDGTYNEIGNTWNGIGYRVDSGYWHKKGLTAKDVVDYEADESDNEDAQAGRVKMQEMGIDLSKYPANDIIWVCKTKTAARRYGQWKDIESIPIKNGIIVSEDGDGGYLVLMRNSENIVESPEKNINFAELSQDKLDSGIDRDDAIYVAAFPLSALSVSKRGLLGAIADIKQGRPSKTDEPILIYYNTEKRQYLVEDGYHRVAQAYLNKEKTIPANIYSSQYSDYVANIGDENKFNLNEVNIMQLNDLPFKDEIEQIGGKILSVGGAVRDEFLGKESKDLDILITGVPIDTLAELLTKYGKVDTVGKSFGVIKFKPRGSSEDIDIAIPRKETISGVGGHKGFDVVSNHELSVEDDLSRRDITINAIAKDINGNIIDPYNGREDLKNKIIRAVNPNAFSDDPLRMLRAVQFASRFGFTIEPETMNMIKKTAARIKEITPERILIELEKIVKKGNPLVGIESLVETGLFREIFGKDIEASRIERRDFPGVKTMGEFVFLMTYGVIENPAEFYKINLKGDIDSYNEIRALNMAFNTDLSNEGMPKLAARSIAHNMYLVSPQSLKSPILPEQIETAANDLLSGAYPKTVNELALNGNDLMQAGLKGIAIGNAQKMLLLKIYGDKVKNTRADLLAILTEPNLQQEGVGDKYAEKRFGIPDTDRLADLKYSQQQILKTEEPVAYVTDIDNNICPIFKNPKSLSNFEGYVRAIADKDGNIYVAAANNMFNHIKMADELGIENFSSNLNNYVALVRVANKNSFGLSDTTEWNIQKGEEERKLNEEILRKARIKNPQYEFFMNYYAFSLDEVERLNEREKRNKYAEAKKSLSLSKSIGKEMKELIAKYMTGGSTYHMGGRVHGLLKPKEFSEKTPKSQGVSLGADKDGFYCYTHRAASPRHATPGDIPIKEIEFIESTG